jgi:hypothetical protein
MKKLLLTGIAALLLVTGTAHAMPYEAFRCGKHQIEMIPEKYSTPREGDPKYPCGPCDSKTHYYYKNRIVDRWIKETEREITFKGKQCRTLREWEIK